MSPASRRGVLITGAVVLAACIALVAVVAVQDDDTPLVGGPHDPAAIGTASVLDDLFPDRPTAPPADPTPTANPAGARDAASQLVAVETAWTDNMFGGTDVLVLLINHSDAALANVATLVVAVDESGAEVGRAEAAFPKVEPGQVVPVTTQLPVDSDAIADLVVETRARGTLPAGTPGRVDDVNWTVDDNGTVVLTGTFTPDSFAEFVAIVGVMRDGAGAFVGFAFGLIDAVGVDGQAFEATGFPAGEVVDIEVYATR